MDWTWFEQMPAAVQYSLPLIVLGILFIIFRATSMLVEKTSQLMTHYIFFNALGIVGILVGAFIIGLRSDQVQPNHALEWLGHSLFTISITYLCGYNIMHFYKAWFE